MNCAWLWWEGLHCLVTLKYVLASYLSPRGWLMPDSLQHRRLNLVHKLLKQWRIAFPAFAVIFPSFAAPYHRWHNLSGPLLGCPSPVSSAALLHWQSLLWPTTCQCYCTIQSCATTLHCHPQPLLPPLVTLHHYINCTCWGNVAVPSYFSLPLPMWHPKAQGHNPVFQPDVFTAANILPSTSCCFPATSLLPILLWQPLSFWPIAWHWWPIPTPTTTVFFCLSKSATPFIFSSSLPEFTLCHPLPSLLTGHAHEKWDEHLSCGIQKPLFGGVREVTKSIYQKNLKLSTMGKVEKDINFGTLHVERQ